MEDAISVSSLQVAPEDDIFSQVQDEGVVLGKYSMAANYLLEVLDLHPCRGSVVIDCQKIPIFLGHGVDDPKVPLTLGEEASSFLHQLDLNVQWQEYQSLGQLEIFFASKPTVCRIETDCESMAFSKVRCRLPFGSCKYPFRGLDIFIQQGGPISAQNHFSNLENLLTRGPPVGRTRDPDPSC